MAMTPPSSPNRGVFQQPVKSPTRHIIIDTKYYAQALQSYWGAETYQSANLYQIFSYLKNAALQDRRLADVEGILLYPWVHTGLREVYDLQGHKLTLATLNLAQDWKFIHRDLLELLQLET
jgi:5-methylcytosine-specific restriction enzyme subunit McrC